MEPNRFELEERLFHEAMAMASTGRREHVRRAANGDGELTARLHRMIEHAECAEGTLAVSPAAAFGIDVASKTPLTGAVIGHYLIVDLIGEGGFGTVYRAEQRHPVRRTVAMKILNGGIDSERVIARFEAERQALAVMEHPSIARVFDAGQTAPDQGSRPFFVMELVTGEPITAYCDRHRLDWKARLELFITVCSAVQHAHQKGIIHRDLKPSNVLVTEVDGMAMPKIIDFGIAKAVHQSVGTQAPLTQHMEMVGTPQYMSPEQAESEVATIDTRTDIYSLGVLLYELLAGTPPLETLSLQGASYTRLQQIICEQAIERPSSRVRRAPEGGEMIAQGRSSDVSSLRRRLRGELDWIVLKALEKDRQRRYQSASEFANDLRKYLNHEPVEAGPPGVAYRLRKFVRRHRLGVTAATLVALALLGGAVVATVAMVHAQDSASRALGINQFMNDVLTSTNPDKGGANVQLAEVLGTASATVSQRFADHPELEAQVRELLGKVFMNLTMWAEAIAEMNQAHAIWVSVRGPDDQRTLNVQLLHARALTNQARHRDAERVLMDLAPRIERTLDPEHPLALDAQRSVGTNQWYLGRYDEAERTLRQAFLRAQRVGPDEPVRVGLMDAIVRMLQHQMRDAENDRVEPIRAELETLARELAERSARLVGPDSSPTLRARVALARAILQRGDFTAAAALAQDVMTASDQRLADCHDLRTEAVNVLTWARYRLGDSAQAADLKLMELQCRRSRSDPIGVLSSIYEAMPFLDQGGRWSEGEMLAREMSATLKDYGGGHGDMLLGAEACIARFVSLQGRLDEAELLFEPLLAQLKEAKVEGFVAARLNLFYGSHLARQGRYEAAEQRLQQAAQLLGPGRHGTWDTVPDDLIVAFTELYEAWGKPEKVAEYQPLRAQALSIVDAE